MEENVPKPKIKKIPNCSALKDSILINYGVKILLGFFVVLIFLTAIRCSIKKPESPTWTTNLTVPLVNRTYQMAEIIEKIDQPNLYVDSTLDSTGADGISYYSYTPVFSYNETLDTIAVTDNLSVAELSHRAVETLGDVTIFPDNPDPIVADLSDHVSFILGVGVPPSSFDITEDIPSIAQFSEATISSGSFDVLFTNDFGLDLDTVIISVYDLVNLSFISTDTIPDPGLAAGDIDTMTVDLAGQTISNNLQLQIHCHTPGSGPSFTLADRTLSSAMEMENGLTVSSAVAEIPEIIRNFQETVDLSEANTIQSAVLESGSISFLINNSTELEANFQVTLEDFKSGGTPLSLSRSVLANSITQVDVDLAGYTFAPVDQSLPQSMSIDIEVVVDSTAPSMVTIDQSDSLSVDADVSSLTFSSMTGIIEPTDAVFDDFSVDIDLPKGFDNIQFSGAILSLEIENAVDFSGTLDLLVSGDNGQTLNITGIVAAGSYDAPVITTIQRTDLSSFLNPIPTNIIVTGTASFGDGISSGTITSNDFILTNVKLDSPLEVIIGETSFDGDITSETINQNDIDNIIDHLLSAEFISTVVNHLPIGVTAEIYLDADSTRLNAADAQLVIGPLTISPGIIGSGTIVTEPVTSENIITLDSNDIKILQNSPLYIGQLITLMDTNGNPVRLSGDDYYTAQGVISVEYKFDGEF